MASLGIDYDSLTPEEIVTQINILKKSKHLKTPGKNVESVHTSVVRRCDHASQRRKASVLCSRASTAMI